MIRNAALLLTVFATVATGLTFMTRLPVETTYELAIGWAAFIERSFRLLTVSWNGIATAFICIVFLIVGGQPFLKWLTTSLLRPRPSGASPEAAAAAGALTGAVAPWSLKRTVQLLVVFMLLFMAGTAFIGLIHQAAWLATAPEPLTRYRLKDCYFASEGNLKWSIAMGFHGFRDVFKQVPPNGSAPQLKQASHSWMTRILPFANVRPEKIDMTLDWDDSVNAPAFRRFVPYYLNPDIGVLRDDRGYAVSHYAGNSRFFTQRSAVEGGPPSDGAANTILCGEVVSDFTAWGNPANLRDPADGVNQTPRGFGSTDERGANFLMLDGAVRFLASETDQDVLARLATPEAQ